jgi:predicted short-subunit dehydrogenase-like oxidoreductase (DUF2520 family)
VTPLKIVIAGTGNVAAHLAKAFQKNGQEVLQIVGRNLKKAEGLAGDLGAAHSADYAQIDAEADVILLAVKDDAISEVAEQIPAETKAVVAHCSGSMPIDILARFKKHGVFYPLQTISKKKNSENVELPVCIEASTSAAAKMLRQLAGTISGNIVVMDSVQRLKVHLSAVFINNFVNHLYRVAFDMLEKDGIDPAILKPLLLETAMKAIHHHPSTIQTGPAARHDKRTLELHRHLLNWHPEYKVIYDLLSKGIEREG